MGIIRFVIRVGLVGVLSVWMTVGLLMYWLFGMTQNQYINVTVDALMVPARVAYVITVHGFGYNLSSDVLYGTPERRAAAADVDRIAAERAAAGCSGYNPNCRTAAERAQDQREKEARDRRASQ